MSTPSAPTAIDARDIGATLLRLPVPWLGSTRIGRWLIRLMAGTIERSRVLRVWSANVRTPALAEDHLVVPLRHDVFGGEEKLFERSRHAPFEKHRLARPPGGFEERKVLHVARADLDAVGVLVDQRQALRVDRFRDDGEVELLAHPRQDLQPFLPEALEGVGRGAGLVGAAPDRAGRRHP